MCVCVRGRQVIMIKEGGGGKLQQSRQCGPKLCAEQLTRAGQATARRTKHLIWI